MMAHSMTTGKGLSQFFGLAEAVHRSERTLRHLTATDMATWMLYKPNNDTELVRNIMRPLRQLRLGFHNHVRKSAYEGERLWLHSFSQAGFSDKVLHDHLIRKGSSHPKAEATQLA